MEYLLYQNYRYLQQFGCAHKGLGKVQKQIYANPAFVFLGIVENYIEITKDLRGKLQSLCKSA